MAAMPSNMRRIVGVLTVVLLGLFGVVWVGANPVGGGVLIALSFVRLVMLVRDLRGDASSDELRARLAQLDKEIAEAEAGTDAGAGAGTGAGTAPSTGGSEDGETSEQPDEAEDDPGEA